MRCLAFIERCKRSSLELDVRNIHGSWWNRRLRGVLLVTITRRLVTGTYLIAFEFHTIRVRGYCWSRDLDESLARASQDSERERTRCRPYVVSATFLRSESFSGRGVAWMASTTYIISFRLYVRWWFVIECSEAIYSKSSSCNHYITLTW